MQSTTIERAVGRPQRSVRGVPTDRAMDTDRARQPVAQVVRAVVSIVASAAWYGLIAGFLELGILMIWHRLAIATVLGALQMNRHFPWMIPIGQMVVFLVCGVPVAMLAVVRPRPGAAGREHAVLDAAMLRTSVDHQGTLSHGGRLVGGGVWIPGVAADRGG